MSLEIEEQISERLRELRRQRGLTLAECEASSNGKFKAVVLGSYERGNRAISILRLQELSDFYGVELISFFSDTKQAVVEDREGPNLEKVIFDLRRVSQKRDERDALVPVRALLRRIIEERMDFNGEVLTLRRGDIDSLALLHDGDRASLITSLRKNSYLFGQ